jgi:hypothetical protein
MDSTPSPLDRLLCLEGNVEKLYGLQRTKSSAREPDVVELPSRHLWPVDEVLLTRLLRRSPEALTAYCSPAQITATATRGVLLTVAETASAFQVCELSSGDAVVWILAEPPSWVWESETFKTIFKRPVDILDPSLLVVQSLPLFKAVVSGKQWSLFRAGEMVPRNRLSPEMKEQVTLLKRFNKLERHISQELLKHNHEIIALRSQLLAQQELIDRLLRLSDHRY